MVWSQSNNDYYGRDNSEELVELPWRGWTNALVRARIPYLPVHADHLARDADRFSALILPNLAAMSAAQVEAVARFMERGGGLVATGEASRCDEWGAPRSDFSLGDWFGAHVVRGQPASLDPAKRRWAMDTRHTYLRLTPELGARAYGPKTGNEPRFTANRHPALKGFDETDLLPFGGMLEALRVDRDASVLATFIPEFPAFPPESAWMRAPRTDIPGLIVREAGGGGRVAFLPADLDRRFGRDNLPDHAELLANLVRWTARDNLPLQVAGAGLVDCHLYQQPGRLVLHLVNLTNAATWRAPADELIPIGPLNVRVHLPNDVRGHRLQFLVAKRAAKASLRNGWAHFDVPTVLDHEVVVMD
jgi:hypothetical protein